MAILLFKFPEKAHAILTRFSMLAWSRSVFFKRLQESSHLNAELPQLGCSKWKILKAYFG
jgi:hypothetical protein